jgi:hypothetical protein
MKRNKIYNFRGVFSKDILPKVINANESCIINIEDHFKGSGTHWVCIYNGLKSKDVQYFDSFGLYPSDVVLNYMKTGNKGVEYSDVEIQDIDSVMCGYYCCYYIIGKYLGYKDTDILLLFDLEPTKANEVLIRNIATNI